MTLQTIHCGRERVWQLKKSNFFSLEIYDINEIVKTIEFTTISEIKEYIGEDLNLIYKAHKNKVISPATGLVFKIEKNTKPYTIIIPGEKPEHCKNIKEICEVTGWPYYKVKNIIDSGN